MIPPQSPSIAIIGLGYVGLPLAVEFGKKYPVTGFDIKQGRIDELKAGRDSTREVDPAELAEATHLGFTADPEQLATVSRDLVALADRYYASALDGLGFLPLRGRLAVAVAASLYQAIGHAVVRRGALALRGRTVLGRLSLGTAVLRGLLTAALPRVWGGSRSRDPALHPFSLGAPESGTPCPTA